VSGRMRWHLDTGNVIAVVNLRQDGKHVGKLTIEWNDVQKNAIATVTGTIGTKTVKAQRIAP
jgi:hypothetical protein